MKKHNEWIYFIGKNLASSKNSKIVTWNKKIVMSKSCKEYIAWAKDIFVENLPRFLEMKNKVQTKPLYIGFYLYRDSKRRYDFNNINQMAMDLFVKHGYIEDDNVYETIPVFLGSEVVKKDKAGFKITLLDDKYESFLKKFNS